MVNNPYQRLMNQLLLIITFQLNINLMGMLFHLLKYYNLMYSIQLLQL